MKGIDSLKKCILHLLTFRSWQYWRWFWHLLLACKIRNASLNSLTRRNWGILHISPNIYLCWINRIISHTFVWSLSDWSIEANLVEIMRELWRRQIKRMIIIKATVIQKMIIFQAVRIIVNDRICGSRNEIWKARASFSLSILPIRWNHTYLHIDVMRLKYISINRTRRV